MVDHLTSEERSALMARIRGSNTAPERKVRQLVWGIGYRYRLNVRSLPGSPDLVFPRLKLALFVHGCFWHYHKCPRFSMPKSRVDFWEKKLQRNQTRDAAAITSLRKAGWRVLVVWECEVADPVRLKRRLARFLGRTATRLGLNPP
jgi:DNA mismatch endonuclease (patch repair protein)